jgi:hypothetical protein
MSVMVRVEKAAFEQVRSFLDEHPELLARVNASDARSALDQAIVGMAAGEDEQHRHRRTSREARVDAVTAQQRLLKKQMRAVAAAARLKAVDEPKLFGLAAPPANAGLTTVLAAAKKMVGDTQAYVHVLAPVIGADYLDKLSASIEAADRAQVTGRTSRAQGTVATKEVKRSLDRGRLALRVIDPLVAEALENEPKLLAEWNARRKKVGATRPASASDEVEGVTVSLVPSSEEVKAAA